MSAQQPANQYLTRGAITPGASGAPSPLRPEPMPRCQGAPRRTTTDGGTVGTTLPSASGNRCARGPGGEGLIYVPLMAAASGAVPEHFEVGSTVLRREVLHGLPWMEQLVTVVHDDGHCPAVLLEPGSRLTFFEHPFGPHPWNGQRAWMSSSVLQVQRDGDAHSVWKFFDLCDTFTHWYVNFQAPLVRRVGPDGGGVFETADLGVDIVIPPGQAWQWKDTDHPDAMVATGRISQAERDDIQREATSVAAQLDAGRRWWSPWDAWRPTEPPPEPVALFE